MKPIPTPYELQLFICTNAKDKGACCAQKGASQLRDELKKICREKYGKRVRVNAAGCMGICEKGIAAAIYPQNEWFEDVAADDKEQLLQRLDSLLEK